MIHSARVHVVRMRVRSYKVLTEKRLAFAGTLQASRKYGWYLQERCKPYMMFWDCPDKTK